MSVEGNEGILWFWVWFLFFMARKKLPSHCPEQVDFYSGQVRLHSDLPRDQASHLLTKTFAIFESYLSQWQAEIQVLFKPCCGFRSLISVIGIDLVV